MIKIENLSKDWKKFKIDNISLEINDNEYFVFLGPSGSGKTMLLELIAGMWSPDSGKVYMLSLIHILWNVWFYIK